MENQKDQKATKKKIMMQTENTKEQGIAMNCLKDSQLRHTRIKHNFSRPKLTDQSQKAMCDINNIMDVYVRTGMLPNTNPHNLVYVDDYNKPSFETAFESVTNARKFFDQLPTKLKNELQNDYRLFETWVKDPNNYEAAVKYGLAVPHPLKADTTQSKETTKQSQD